MAITLVVIAIWYCLVEVVTWGVSRSSSTIFPLASPSILAWTIMITTVVMRHGGVALVQVPMLSLAPTTQIPRVTGGRMTRVLHNVSISLSMLSLMERGLLP